MCHIYLEPLQLTLAHNAPVPLLSLGFECGSCFIGIFTEMKDLHSSSSPLSDIIPGLALTLMFLVIEPYVLALEV